MNIEEYQFQWLIKQTANLKRKASETTFLQQNQNIMSKGVKKPLQLILFFHLGKVAGNVTNWALCNQLQNFLQLDWTFT